MTENPLRDPRFSDRPQSEFFWAMVVAVNRQDGAALEDRQGPEEIARSTLSEEQVEALFYMASQRALRLGDARAGVLWLEGFLIGWQMAKREESYGNQTAS